MSLRACFFLKRQKKVSVQNREERSTSNKHCLAKWLTMKNKRNPMELYAQINKVNKTKVKILNGTITLTFYAHQPVYR